VYTAAANDVIARVSNSGHMVEFHVFDQGKNMASK
jgi:hypothetical protein